MSGGNSVSGGEVLMDARDLICPLPVLKARKKLMSMQKGQVLRVRVTDASAPKDFGLFCAEQGHELLGITPAEQGHEIVLRRG